MPLIKKHKVTEKKLAANRQNQKLCHGGLTAQGRERIRAAHLRHGFYVKAEEVALRNLGEDPAQFQELLEGLWEEFTPFGSMQEGLVVRLARAIWVMNRADRAQEGLALRLAQDVNVGRENRLHARMMRLQLTAESLRSLARSVGMERYVTTPSDLELMKGLQLESEISEMGQIAVSLFLQLRDPADYDQDGHIVSSQEAQTRVLIRIKEIFGLATDDESAGLEAHINPQAPEERYPNINAQQWAAREPVRQLLENMLNRLAEICETQRHALLKESVSGPSPYERAAEIAPIQAASPLLRRMQDSYFREVKRVTNLLLKIKRRESGREALENTRPFQDIAESKGVRRDEQDPCEVVGI